MVNRSCSADSGLPLRNDRPVQTTNTGNLPRDNLYRCDGVTLEEEVPIPDGVSPLGRVVLGCTLRQCRFRQTAHALHELRIDLVGDDHHVQKHLVLIEFRAMKT
jgi:hypothetical protein